MQQIGRLVEEIVILSDAFQYFRFQDSSPQIVTVLIHVQSVLFEDVLS